jgi:hypothetical protein
LVMDVAEEENAFIEYVIEEIVPAPPQVPQNILPPTPAIFPSLMQPTRRGRPGMRLFM